MCMDAMNEILDRIGTVGIVPVVVIDRAEDAPRLGEALCDGGLPCAEVTFRTEAAAEAIAVLKREFPHMLVGAGTVLTPRQADQAMEAGAAFLVSPGLNVKLLDYCLGQNYPMIPGCMTPGEIEQAMERGLRTVKFFPAEAAGGIRFIRALAAPYRDVRFMPTGGIHAGNVEEYLAFDRVLACGGSWMVKGDLIAAGDFDRIRQLTREAVQLVARCRGTGAERSAG